MADHLMKEMHYDQLNETIYQRRLANGLQVYLHPKPEFNKTFGVFSTNYGGVDTVFLPDGAEDLVKTPAGVAHFLEHKLFEKEDGDVMHKFAALGATTNAFTSYTQTSYLFSATSHIHENVHLLLDFVQDPYFNEASIEREKDIIGQEISLYRDEADWYIQEMLTKALYPSHPVREDILGTYESIDEIDRDILMTCYETFYHPSNMQLFITGNFDLDEMMETILDNQEKKGLSFQYELQRAFPREDLSKIKPYVEEEMDISRPKVMMGIRGVMAHHEGMQSLRWQQAVKFGLKMLFGATSSNYQELLNEQLIDSSFSCGYEYQRSFDYLYLVSDTDEPKLLVEKLTDILKRSSRDDNMNEENFELVKRQSIGRFIQSLDSLEYIATSFPKYDESEVTLFNLIDAMESVTLKDVKEVMDYYLNLDYSSVAILTPKSEV